MFFVVFLLVPCEDAIDCTVNLLTFFHGIAVISHFSVALLRSVSDSQSLCTTFISTPLFRAFFSIYYLLRYVVALHFYSLFPEIASPPASSLSSLITISSHPVHMQTIPFPPSSGLIYSRFIYVFRFLPSN